MNNESKEMLLAMGKQKILHLTQKLNTEITQIQLTTNQEILNNISSNCSKIMNDLNAELVKIMKYESINKK
ncbi:MAG: hypothetical protein ACI7YS_16180 [Flavobacterium sp.]